MAKKRIQSKFSIFSVKTLILAAFLLIIPQIIFANGEKESADNDSQFRINAEKLIQAVSDGEMSSEEAKAELEKFRLRSREEYTDRYRKMEQILTDLENKKMTTKEAKEMLAEMERERLRERDRLRIQEEDSQGKSVQNREEKQTAENPNGK